MENKIALYRKYRPHGFDHLIGQDHVKITLENAISNNAVSHAYAFTGPRGTGKTSTAKLFAKALNCDNPKGVNPCGTCHSCTNESSDIIEIDAASNNSVDDIRQLRENVQLAPMYGKYKIYILDEVHMLTTQAFNAFLKTLEEPPAHARFILATTEVHKLPATILSRCQRFDFKRITNKDIVARLTHILAQENRTAETQAIELIAQVSAGGMRDAISLLDQSLSRKANLAEAVTLDEVLALTGSVDVRVIGQLLDLINKGLLPEALAHFNKCFESGKEPKFFIEELMIYLRDILVFKKLGASATLKKGNTDVNFPQVAAQMDLSKIFAYLDELQKTLSEVKHHHDLQLLLEMMIIRMVNGNSDLQAQIDEIKLALANGSTVFSSENIMPLPIINESNVANNLDLNDAVLKTMPLPLEINSEVPEFTHGLEEFNAPADNGGLPEFTHGLEEFNVPADNGGLPEFTHGLEEFNAPADNGGLPEFNDNNVEDVNDPIGFISMAIEESRNGNDWTNLSTGTEGLAHESVDVPSTVATLEPPSEMPVTNSSNQMNELVQQPASVQSGNIILSEREKLVYDQLSSANKELKEQLEQVMSNIKYELGNVNISTKRLFDEFTIKAVNNTHFIIVHDERVKVALITKLAHSKAITEVMSNTYKPLAYIAITQEEWLTVIAAFKANTKS